MKCSAPPRIVIVGGGVIGSSIACYLGLAGAGADVTVIEPDPTYQLAATPRATGTIRRTFTLPEKIQMSAYAQQVYSDFETFTAIDGKDGVDVQFHRGGFLYMAWGNDEVAYLERAHAKISEHYPSIELLSGSEISALYPSIDTSDVDIGLFARDDGWIDPASALWGYRKKAQSLGVTYLSDRVVGFQYDKHRIHAVELENGSPIAAEMVVNCANCWAADVAAMVGMKIPIEPLQRMTYYFETRDEIEPLPLTRDINGISVRPEGTGYITGMTNFNQPYGFNWDLDYDWFDEAIWPQIAKRIPTFESLKMKSCWAGHYDMNTFDGTTILGPWTGGIDNFYVTAGFSGHGLQQAPAVGRAMSELLLDGRYQTIDLTRLGYQRVLDETPLIDEGIRS